MIDKEKVNEVTTQLISLFPEGTQFALLVAMPLDEEHLQFILNSTFTCQHCLLKAMTISMQEILDVEPEKHTLRMH